LTPAHDILFWDQVIETDQSRFFVLRRILFGFSVISIHAKPFDSDLFSGAEFEKCSPICQQRRVKHEDAEKFHAFLTQVALGKKRARTSSLALPPHDPSMGLILTQGQPGLLHLDRSKRRVWTYSQWGRWLHRLVR
jgi:hypothetical protein